MTKAARAATARVAENPAAGRAARSARTAAALGALAVVAGIVQAVRLAWTTDDAYISFRYARNLVDGLGLVFNAGERVEGYSNFLWTILCAAGLRLGVAPERWANFWSIACFAGTLAVLVLLTRRRARRGEPFAAIPLAALALALHHDACVFATGGLETSMFTFLAVLGYAALEPLGHDGTMGQPAGESRAAGLAALALGLAALARPDGAVFAAIGAIYVPWAARAKVRASLVYLLVTAAIAMPYAAWKLAYYGDLLPNTYYAKSAALAWWSQGLTYLSLYARRYSVLVAAPLLALGMAAMRAPETGAPRRAPGVLAACFAIAYTVYVTRVGGDFMFARLLIPAAPFCALALEHAIAALAARTRGGPWPSVAAAAALGILAFSPNPVRGPTMIRGIANEREYYEDESQSTRQRKGENLEELARGLPVRAAIAGTQAIIGYYSRVPVLVETAAGLTDRYVARLPLAARGRVGHEKHAPLAYLIEGRRLHFEVGRSRPFDDSLASYVPVIHLGYKFFDATLLTWDPPLMEELRRRGATFPEFLPYLDRLIESLPGLPDSVARDAYAQARRFYFAGFPDSIREAAFVRRLARAAAIPQAGPGRTR